MKERSQENAEYQIRLQGHLPADWLEWFDGFSIEHLAHGETKMTGSVADQTALHSLIQRIRDLGIILIEVKRISGIEELGES